MNSNEIITELKSQSSEKYKANVVRMGIPKDHSIGVPTSVIRSLAKKTGKSNELAHELWNTGYHEARLLAVLLFDCKSMTRPDIEKLMSDVISWDLCDHLCKNLIVKMKGYADFIVQWIDSDRIYEKRASFALMASAALHDKKITSDSLDTWLQLIYENSGTEHEHVKKAASWALREIGKKDFEYNEKAIQTAHELLENGNKTQKWIAKDALKELENLVKVEGRGRLISTKTQMGSAL